VEAPLQHHYWCLKVYENFIKRQLRNGVKGVTFENVIDSGRWKKKKRREKREKEREREREKEIVYSGLPYS
jgi:hypothetical protein